MTAATPTPKPLKTAIDGGHKIGYNPQLLTLNLDKGDLRSALALALAARKCRERSSKLAAFPNFAF